METSRHGIKAQKDGKFWRVLGMDIPLPTPNLKKEIPDTKDWMLSKFLLIPLFLPKGLILPTPIIHLLRKWGTSYTTS